MARGFGQVDYSRLDRMRQIVNEAVQNKMAVDRAQNQADIEKAQLNLKLVENEQTSRLLNAYQRIMASNEPAETKLNQVGPILGLTSRINPQLAQSMNEQTGRMVQSENLGLRKSEIQSTEESRRAMEADRQLGLQLRLAGQKEQERYHDLMLQKQANTDADKAKSYYHSTVDKLGRLDAINSSLDWTDPTSPNVYKSNLNRQLNYLDQIQGYAKDAGYPAEDWINTRRKDIQSRLAGNASPQTAGGTDSTNTADPLGILSQ